MGITADQRALLQLLLQRGQSYSDIASLLDVSEEDARSRARLALEALGGSDPDEHVGLTDYLLGQADPIGRADAVRHLQSCERCSQLAADLLPQLQLLAPDAELPQPPPLRGRSRATRSAPRAAEPPAAQAPAAPKDRPKGPRRLGATALPPRTVQLLAGLVAAAVAVAVVVLVVSGGGDNNEASTTTTSSTQAAAGGNFVKVNLRPVAGSSGSGLVLFSVNGRRVSLDVQGRQVPPSPQGKFYVVWLYNSAKNAYPLATTNVGPDGRLSVSRTISSQVAALLPGVKYVDVSLETSGTQIPRHRGVSVLRGPIPGGPTTASGSTTVPPGAQTGTPATPTTP